MMEIDKQPVYFLGQSLCLILLEFRTPQKFWCLQKSIKPFLLNTLSRPCIAKLYLCIYGHVQYLNMQIIYNQQSQIVHCNLVSVLILFITILRYHRYFHLCCKFFFNSLPYLPCKKCVQPTLIMACNFLMTIYFFWDTLYINTYMAHSCFIQKPSW